MSILKFINGKNRGNQSLRDAIFYVTNPEKTSSEYIAGNGIDTEYAYQDMVAVQRILGQAEGRRYIHYILSFDKGIRKTEVWSVCREAAGYFGGGFQYIMALHCNTANLHMHVILNAVNFRTGKKFSQSRGELQQFKDYVNTILRRYGLNPVEDISEGDWPDEMEMTVDDITDDFEMADTGIQIGYLDEIYDCDNYEDEDPYDESYGYEDDFYEYYDEETAIREAENQSNIEKEIIAFFEGRRGDLPVGVNYDDAELMYWQWQDSQNWDDEYY